MTVKRYREGTLRGFDSDGADVSVDLKELNKRNPDSIYGFDDFLAKADALADEMLASGPVRAKVARKLKIDVERIREALSNGIDWYLRIDREQRERFYQQALFDAIGAALSYSNLAKEKRDDQPARGKRKRTTRTAYFAAKKKAKTRAKLAERLGLSDQGLRDWEERELKP